MIKTADRESGVRSLLDKFDMGEFRGATVAIKANFNSADPFPASTHLSTLEELVKYLNDAGTKSISLAERSGMGGTRRVLEALGVMGLAGQHSFRVIILDEERHDRWQKVEKGNTHWLHGFYISKEFLEAERVVQTCCLKTHRFGGHFTMSLKNSVGIVAKRIPGSMYDYMWELHATPNQRLKIAEVNSFYRTDLVLMDGIKAFVTEGPDRGRVVEPNLMLASRDRVAIDAVGVAVLRRQGVAGTVASGRVFDQDQLHRASELGIGAKSPDDIKLVPLNAEDEADTLERILRA
jgi:uncharacterized protein (DUF362 family)